MRYLTYDMKHFREYFPKMWTFAFEHFGHGLDYEYTSISFTVGLKTDEEYSFFLMYWSDKVNALS